jgi:hypothetical protein
MLLKEYYLPSRIGQSAIVVIATAVNLGKKQFGEKAASLALNLEPGVVLASFRLCNENRQQGGAKASRKFAPPTSSILRL